MRHVNQVDVHLVRVGAVDHDALHAAAGRSLTPDCRDVLIEGHHHCVFLVRSTGTIFHSPWAPQWQVNSEGTLDRGRTHQGEFAVTAADSAVHTHGEVMELAELA